MDKTNLETSKVFTATLDVSGRGIVIPQNGKLVTPPKTIDIEGGSKEIEQARKFGGEILYAVTDLESKIRNILCTFFMGVPGRDRNPGVRDLFNAEILQSPHFSFHAKKELLVKVVNSYSLLTGKKKNLLSKHLKKLMDWRNMFAHGEISYDATKGCLIKYYQGSHKVMELTDEFYSSAKVALEGCRDLLNNVSDSLLRSERLI